MPFLGGADGYAPGPLLQASDGNFYGTAAGGSNGKGTIFKMTAAGALTTVHTFDGTDGAGPYGLIQDTDGAFYGLTGGGTANKGTVFSLSVGPLFPLKVSVAGAGSGTVASSPTGINCPSSCTANFNSPAPVTLTPTPVSGSSFAGWSGACSGSGGCSVIVTAAMSVTATFVVATTTTLAITATPSESQANVGSATLTATVAHTTGTAAPSGTVTFMNGATSLGSAVTVSNGVAIFNGSSLAVGNYSVTAAYSGDATYAKSNSLAAGLDIVDFKAPTANPTAITISAPGGSGMTTLSYTPENGFNQILNWSCAGLPSEATCAFAAGTTANTEIMTVRTMAASARLDRSPFNRRVGPFYALLLSGVLGLVAVTAGNRKRTLHAARMLGLVAFLALSTLWLPACGGGGSTAPSNPGTPTGTVGITVTAATSGTSALSHSVTVTLTVQ
jgi:uncharacterized repeat protein (TIGR03803 family)